MNPWQCFRQIQSTLRAEVWPGSATSVFPTDSVLVSAAPSPGVFDTLIMPTAILRPLSVQADPEHDQEPGLLVQQCGLTLAQIVAGDAVGEHALMGAIRQDDDSAGRGLLELEARVLSAIEILNGLEGFSILNRFQSAPKADTGGNRYVAWRDYLFEMTCSSEATYEPAGSFVTSESGGTVTLTWTLPTGRYDISSAILRRASGSTAPATKTDGTGVTLASALALTVDDTPGSGTFSYSIFVDYDDGTSDPRSKTVVVT